MPCLPFLGLWCGFADSYGFFFSFADKPLAAMLMPGIMEKFISQTHKTVSNGERWRARFGNVPAIVFLLR